MDRGSTAVLVVSISLLLVAAMGFGSLGASYEITTNDSDSNNSNDDDDPHEKCGPSGTGNGIDDDGDGQVDEGCGGIDPNGSTGNPGTCWDGNDNDNDGDTDASDDACVDPNTNDGIEGNIWDLDLTATMEGGAPTESNAESVFYEGELRKADDTVIDSDTGGSDEVWVEDEGTEGDYYAYGLAATDGIGGYPAGTVTSGDRVIDPPNPDGGDTCGDGLENDGAAPSPDGQDEPNPSGSVPCIKDYGQLLDTPDVNSPYKRDGMECRDDVASCTSSSCSGSACGSPSCTDADCDVDTDYSGDESNEYWLTNGDTLEHYECTVDCTDCVASASGCSAGDSSTCCGCFDQYGSCTCFGSECSASGDSAGDERSFDMTETIDCNTHNVIDGGGDTNDDEYGSKADNDPAAAFTDYTAHADNSIGSDGKVWCGYEDITVVDADGPRGYGDGFVLIESGSITATMSPDGTDNVGQRVYVNGAYKDRQDLITTSCPGDKTVCIRYVDYQTRTSGWKDEDSATAAGNAPTVSDEVFTPDDAYSVCKMVNYINEQNGDGTEILDCDYERGGDVSPLPEACDDEPSEHLILMEGEGEIKSSTSKQYLAYEQRCVDWADDQDYWGDSLTSSACVNKGAIFAEGTVFGAQVTNLPESFEQGGESPDLEVCLDIDDGTGDNRVWDNDENDGTMQDYGGEWYDLDDERVNDYLNGAGNSLVTGGSPGDWHDVAYYWRENMNPYHSSYNPRGAGSPDGNTGLALEDDCGPLLTGCDDVQTTTDGKTPVFYSFFWRPA